MGTNQRNTREPAKYGVRAEPDHPRSAVLRAVASLAAVGVLTHSLDARAVTCHSAQALNGPSGSTKFGHELAMYTDHNGTDYVIVAGHGYGLWYASKASTSDTWSAFTQIDSNLETSGGPDSLAVSTDGVIVAGTPGGLNVYSQTQNSFFGPVGPPFNYTQTLTPSGLSGNGDAWATISLMGGGVGAATLAACDWYDNACYAFQPDIDTNTNGRYTWQWVGPQISVFSSGLTNPSTGTPIALGPFVDGTAFGFTTGASCNGTTNPNTCTTIWEASNALLAPLWGPAGYMSSSSFSTPPAPAGYKPGGLAGLADGVFVGMLGTGSTPGFVQAYSNGYASGAAIGSAWTASGAISAPSGASVNFGARIKTTPGYLMVVDPGANPYASNTGIYTYQVNYANGSISGATYTLMDAVTAQGQGAAIDTACEAFANESANQITLYPVSNPPQYVCCTGSSCVSAASTSCPVSASPTLYIPTVSGGFVQPTLTSGCTYLSNAFSAPTTGTCETVQYTGTIAPSGATMCFPGYTPGQPFQIWQCKDNGQTTPPPDCVGTYPYPKSDPTTNRHFCCRYPEQEPDSTGTQLCAFNLTSFSTFGFGVLVDTDSDGTPDVLDNCPTTWNPTQADKDHDSIGDVCDNCPAVPNQNQLNTTGASVGDACNCALPGVKLGPTGAACAQSVPTPAMPRRLTGMVGLFLAGAGVWMARARRKFERA